MGDADVCPGQQPAQDFETLFAETELLKKNCIIQNIADVQIGSAKWEVRQDLQDKYRTLLLTNLEMSIKNGIEMDLWRYSCYNFISKMQQHMAQYKNIAGLYKIFLNASTGFFSQLLQELCEAYRKKIKAMPSARYLGLIEEKGHRHMVEEHFKYICHFCLVKLGDISRYHNDSNCAKAFYHQALLVKPLNGQPYNQLAILSATNKDDIETLYLHVRSIAASFPFPAGQTNLNSWLLKCVSDVKTSDKLYANFNFLVFRVLYEREPMTLAELCRDFLEEAKGRMKLANRPFGDMFLKLSAILIFLHKQSLSKGEEYQAPVYGLIVEFMSVLASEAEENGRIEATKEILPTLVILAHWFQKYYTREKDDMVPASLWADLNSFVKKQSDLPDDDKNVTRATLEEEELRSFEPLQEVLKVLQPCDKNVNLDVIRVMRLRNLLHWAAINKMTAFEHETLLHKKALSFGEDKVNSAHLNSVPLSPMFVPYPLLPGAQMPYPMNAPEQHRPQFPVNRDPPFLPPPETQRPSLFQQYPSVMYHDMAMSLPGVHDSRKTEQRDFSAQNFIPPPGAVQSFVHSNKFMAGTSNKFGNPSSNEEKLQSLRANVSPLIAHLPPQAASHMAPQAPAHLAPQVQSHLSHQAPSHMQAPQVDQRNVYRPSPMFTGPFMQRPNNNSSNSQFPVNNNLQFPLNNNSHNNMAGMLNNHAQISLQNGLSKKEEDFANAFVSSSVSSPFSLGSTPWAPATSDPMRRELQDIWSLTSEQEEQEMTLQQLLNGKK